ncbi:MAG: DUF2589 domain-containing protein [Nostocaceae cyanobacterium]|nr:DUF2589 domain-containing protein [Nostocaceae cyanobacterium]
MANIPAELRALPLDHVIGTPLVAAIKAQALAAQTTVDFIKEVGLKPRALETGESEGDDVSGESGQPGFESRYVDFKFDRVLEEEVTTPPPPDSPAGTPPTKTTRFLVVPSKLTVPLLAMVPIPYIRINDMTIDFEFQIKDVETRESTTEKNVSVKAKARGWFYKVNLKGSYSNRTVNKRETDRRTTLKVTVNAVQDEIPEGLGRVLDILNEATKAIPLGTATEVPGVSTSPSS